MSQINEFDFLISMIQKAMRLESRYKYSVPRLGQVKNVQDENREGRVLVIIPSLGWTTDDLGVWCYPSGIKRIVTPKIDDWVIVQWINGNRDEQAIYTDIAYFMKDMLPKNYDGKPTTQILFEDNNKEMFLKYDEETKTYIKQDSHGNKFTLNSSGIIIEDVNNNKITMSSSGIKLETPTTDVTMTSTNVTINNNLEVLI